MVDRKGIQHVKTSASKTQGHKLEGGTLWALREAVNSTTGLSPWMLVFGRVPTGPLTILKEHWGFEAEVFTCWIVDTLHVTQPRASMHRINHITQILFTPNKIKS